VDRIISSSQLSFVVQAHAMSGPPAVVIRPFQRKQDAAAFAAGLAQRVRASGVEALRQET
jgi:hypothetical protein